MKALDMTRIAGGNENPSNSTAGIFHTVVRQLIGTQASVAGLVARLTLAAVMFPHGAQKTLGWFGGYGFSGTMNFFTETMHIPWVFALAAILAEAVGPLLLAAGLATRVAAFAIAANMFVAVATTHLQHGFFMNWFGNQKGEGFEYHILMIGLALVAMIQGGGRYSADRLLTKSPETAVDEATA
jgi:putative oxidoreductase